jgi:predicted aspartyl protease
MKRSMAGAVLAALMAALGPGAADASCKVGKMADLPVVMVRGVPLAPAKVNGRDLKFVVASAQPFTQISPTVAQALNLSLRTLGPTISRGRGMTASSEIDVRTPQGEQRVQVTTVRLFSIGGAEFPNFDLAVSPTARAGDIDGALGQNILGVSDVEYDLAHGAIRLFKVDGCENTAMAYWAADGSASVIEEPIQEGRLLRTLAYANVNGQKMRVLLDSGVAHSVLSQRAAARAGIMPTSPGVMAAGDVPDVDHHTAHTWTAPVASFQIGDEEIKATRLRIGDFDFRGFDMRLGADFLMSHRVYVSSWQRRIYFTYNGGPVFDLSTVR